jgi:elongation factor Ts
MSATITAADINKLRQATGAGMLDCRKALTKAMAILKQQLTGFANKAKK